MTVSDDYISWVQALAAHEIHDQPPVGRPYVLGRWHPSRVTLRGYNRELRGMLRRLLQLRPAPKKFVIIARARSGTTLIKRLMNQVPGVQCDAERLSCAVLAPRAFVNNLARRQDIDAYGVKILTHHMLEVHRMGSGVPVFLQALVEDGFTLIHLRRDTFDQVLSLETARETSSYHMLNADGHTVREVEIDPERFALQFHYSQILLDYEDLLFTYLPHLRLDYEEYLKDADCHQACIDKICVEIGVPSAPVQADLTPTSKRTVITNLQALREKAEMVSARLAYDHDQGVVAR